MRNIDIPKLRQQFYDMYKGAENASKVKPYPPTFPLRAPVVIVNGKKGTLIPDSILEKAALGDPEALEFIGEQLKDVRKQIND